MPTNLPAIGTIKYNEYTFGVMTETKGIRGKAVWDRAGRTITHIVWGITIKTRIAATPPATIAATMVALRQTLMAVGKPFQYEDKGFGDLIVGLNDVKDVSWGPKPIAFNWSPVGNDYAADVEWTVEVAIPECDNAKYRGIMEAVFKVDYERDLYGLTRRTFDGYLKIAITRDGRRLTDTADNYLAKFVPSVPNRFRRVSQRESVSEDKASLTINVLDEELPSENIPPEGIIEAEFEHSIGCNGTGANGNKDFFTRHTGRMSGSYTVARGKKANLAIQNFAIAVQDRCLDLRKDLKKDGQGKAGDLWNILPLTSSVTEVNAYGMTKVKCTFSYLMIGPPSIFMTKGLFRQMRGSDYDLWAKSMAGTWSSRGWAQLKLDVNDDAIIDLCLGGNVNVMKGKKPKPQPPQLNGLNNQAQQGWGWPWPDKDKSFVDIQTSLTLESEDSVLRHVPLESGEARLRTPALLGYDPFTTISALPRGSNPTIYQARAASLPSVIFSGHCIRAGWEIPAPTLKGAFGRAAIPANGPGFGFVQENYPFSGPVPIFIAAWRLRFFLSDLPFKVEGGVNANPVPLPNNNGGGGGGGNAPAGPVPFGGGNNGFGGNQNANQAWTNLFGPGGVSGLGIV